MIPLSTIASLCSSQPVRGCALSSLTAPCVAQRVWPSPVVAREPLEPAARLRFARLPTARTYSSPPASRRTIPAESYPRNSRRSRPAISRSFEGRPPTYPMIPHIPAYPSFPAPERPRARLSSAPASERSAELFLEERGNASTGISRLLLILRLREDAHNRLRPRGPDEHPAAAPELGVEPLDRRADGGGHRLRRDADVGLRLREAGHHRRRLRQAPASERGAEEQRRGEPVAAHVVAQVDQVAGLLAPEHAAFPLERLEHVPVADVGRDHADAALRHQGVEPLVRHLGDGDDVDPEVEREHGDDLVAVDHLAALVHREHPVAVAVEGDTEVEPLVADETPQGAEVGGAAADVDQVAAVGRADRDHLRAEPAEHLRPGAPERAVGAVDADPQAVEGRAEVRADVLHVALERPAVVLHDAAPRRPGLE